MGQLIKLENYVSRYEQDMFHYPAQYVRLKRTNWDKLKYDWENKQAPIMIETEESLAANEVKAKRWTRFFNRSSTEEEDGTVDINNHNLPQTEVQLKQFFLDSLLQFQLKWASTTMREMSFIDQQYQHNLVLKYFLQRFPDTYLFMYNPVFKLKKASIDTDIIMITPVEIYVIKLLELPSSQVIIAGDERTWFTEDQNVRSKLLSPLLSLKRTYKVIQSVLNHAELDIPVHRVVLSRTNQIDFNIEPYQTQFIDRDRHEAWLTKQRQFISPLKHKQLKVAEALVACSDTLSVSRPEWERQDNENFNFE
ncbi:Nuclease-related domain-containing protein [Amphibacillus marinus]|uniref:Nuclease-related domain-containing protein n=1 Tax=Amphibacillus marinus TaxID=872970 RepID=A0A1H8SYN7_9BACI|nr:NERD domain-containing protein [Amphibacillus marinus]SEO83811.1 Nuclease-related domain-containing protein [Amphibacillus marinus]